MQENLDYLWIKSKQMIVTNRVLNNCVEIKFDNKLSEKVCKFKLFGIPLDEKLTFKPHILSLQSKISVLS